jgi:hypothetical protein
MTDDTAYLQAILDRGEWPPPGVYQISAPLALLGGGGGIGTTGGATGGPGRPGAPTTDAVLAEIDAALEDWERGEDAAVWRASGGPDEFAERDCTGMQGLTPTLVLYDEVSEFWAVG